MEVHKENMTISIVYIKVKELLFTFCCLFSKIQQWNYIAYKTRKTINVIILELTINCLHL